jgi:hypothetical protein
MTASALSASELSKILVSPKGYMISTAVLNCASENQDIAYHVSSLRLQSLATFTARIERSVKEGDLKPDTNVGSLARFLGGIVRGMSVQARDGARSEELMEMVKHAISGLERHRSR